MKHVLGGIKDRRWERREWVLALNAPGALGFFGFSINSGRVQGKIMNFNSFSGWYPEPQLFKHLQGLGVVNLDDHLQMLEAALCLERECCVLLFGKLMDWWNNYQMFICFSCSNTNANWFTDCLLSRFSFPRTNGLCSTFHIQPRSDWRWNSLRET